MMKDQVTDDGWIVIVIKLPVRNVPLQKCWFTVLDRFDILIALQERFKDSINECQAQMSMVGILWKVCEYMTAMYITMQAASYEQYLDENLSDSDTVVKVDDLVFYCKDGTHLSGKIEAVNNDATVDIRFDRNNKIEFDISTRYIIPKKHEGLVKLERIELYVAKKVPECVETWLRAQRGVRISSPPMHRNTDNLQPNLTGKCKLCICWPCMRTNLSGQTNDDRSKKQTLQKGSIVMLKEPFDMQANLDALDGPLKPGKPGVVLRCDSSAAYNDQSQNIYVLAFTGQCWWYCREALILMEDPSNPGQGFCSDVIDINATATPFGWKSGSLFRIVQPLSSNTVKCTMVALNKFIFQIPSSFLTSVNDKIPGIQYIDSLNFSNDADEVTFFDGSQFNLARTSKTEAIHDILFLRLQASF